MKIAFFHASLPEPDRKVGGVEVFVHRLANRLSDAGHSVTLFTFGSPPADARYRVVRAGSAWLGQRLAARLTIGPLVLNRLDLEQFDVCHLHGDDWLFLRRPLPTVRTFYGSALLEAWTATSLRRRASQAAIFPLEVVASHLATVSYDIGSQMPPGYRIGGSLALAVDEPRNDTAVERSVHPTVLFVGTWEGRKRGRFLAETFEREVLPRHPSAELWMVSDRCEERSGVRWIRFPSDAELTTLLRTAWVSCAPSTYEGFGVPSLEAMAQGLPVVATPNRGARHVLADGAGLLVADPDLGSVLADLLSDGARRDQLGGAGRRRARQFGWDRVVAEHEAAYQQALTTFRRRSASGCAQSGESRAGSAAG